MKNVLIVVFCLLSILYAEEDLDQISIAKSNNRFGIDIYHSLVDINRIKGNNNNIILSPFSIFSAFAILYPAARYEIRDEFRDVFYIELTDDVFHAALSSYAKGLIQNNTSTDVQITNSIWPDNRLLLLPDYLSTVNGYSPEIIPSNWSEPENVRIQINQWVEEHTNNRIKDLLTIVPKPYPKTQLAIVNTLIFEGSWAKEFPEENTFKGVFYNNGAEVQINMMNRKDVYEVLNYEDYSVLFLPYEENRFTMMVILPNELNGIKEVENKIRYDVFNNLMSVSRQSTIVDVLFPQLKLRYGSVNLNGDPLKKIGLIKSQSLGADFSGLDNGVSNFYVNIVEHQVFIKVDEKGTEAEAATVITGCFPEETLVHCRNGYKPIADVSKGDYVKSYDFLNKQWVYSEVQRNMDFEYSGDIVQIATEENIIRSSGNHPYLVVDGEGLKNRPVPIDIQGESPNTSIGRWVEARHLNTGDIILSSNNRTAQIKTTEVFQQATSLYNLEIKDNHNYCVGSQGVLVHNKGGQESQNMTFYVDHPFMLFILDNESNAILFMGKIINPVPRI